MSTHVPKNYFDDGGDTLVIGGKLVMEEGAESSGIGGRVENQSASTASQVSALKNDFNALLAKLKNAGVMEPDAWNISVRLAPALTDPVAAANNAKASVAYEDGAITITADVDELEESESSAPGQGTHKWIGLGIGTGLDSVTEVTYNGSPLTADDAAEAVSVGLDQNGEFVLYVRAEELAETAKVITLNADSYAEIAISIVVVAPAAD
jgi:hypothetical protein